MREVKLTEATPRLFAQQTTLTWLPSHYRNGKIGDTILYLSALANHLHFRIQNIAP